ncbi:MAG: HAD family hydrolase, partial [Bacillota bacterium]|nr:HAD family hydrolase [Bacillota bacterium]
MYDSFIFDLDGTLWNSTASVTKAWNIAVTQSGMNTPLLKEKDVEGIMGLTEKEIPKKLFPSLNEEEARAMMSHCNLVEQDFLTKHGAILYDSLEDTIAALSRRAPLFIVSNCGHGYIEAFLNHYKLWDYFRDFEYFSRTQRPKGDNIRAIMERNHLKNSVYIGDTQGDYYAAKAAGIPFIHAAYGYGSVDDTTVPVIHSLSELLHWLK